MEVVTNNSIEANDKKLRFPRNVSILFQTLSDVMLDMKPSMITNVNSIFSKVRAAGEQEKVSSTDHTPPTISVGDTVFQVLSLSISLSIYLISLSFLVLLVILQFYFPFN